MSTSVLHQPDTPVSSGSPSSSLGIVEHENSKLDGFDKTEELLKFRHKSSSPPVNGDGNTSSSSSSPSPSITPNLSFIPPSNGILTPPNDSDINNDPMKPESGAGRLKFYKDGVLCLELSHRDEGEKRKWVQIRSKTVFPTVIHTKREVSIPRHASPTPPSFHSPLSSSIHYQQRVESSASHSTSDDGSSMLSSPRIRESSWRKPVPHKGISLHLEFYLNTSICIKKFRRSSSKCSKLKLSRRPNQSHSMSEESQKSSLLCLCDISKNENRTISVEDESDQRRLNNGTKLSRCKNNTTLLAIVEKLQCENERKLRSMYSKLSPSIQENSIPHKQHDPVLLKKRTFRETETKDSFPPVRPSKMSPKTKSVKTILNIPGFNYTDNNMESSQSGMLVNVKPDVKGTGNKNGFTKKKMDVRSPVVNPPSPESPPKLSRKMQPMQGSPPKHSISTNMSLHYPVNSAMYLASLPPKEQQLFQQQTMSKAISYTINSLLSDPHNQQESSRKIALTGPMHTSDKEKIRASKSMKAESKHSLKHHQQSLSHSPYYGVKTDQDQTSFLRHLLDTSDPIPNPNVKPDKSPSQQQSQEGRSSSGKSSTHQTTKESDRKGHNTTTKSKSTKPRESSASPSKGPLPTSTNFQQQISQLQLQQQMGMFQHAAFLHPSLFGGGYPLQLQAYESIFGGQHSSMGALAAELQYQSILTQNLLAMNPSLAASMPMSFLGGANPPTVPPSSHQQHPSVASNPTLGSSPSSSNRSPTPSRRTEPQSQSNGSSGTRPLNLSQRERPNGLMSSASIPVPFQAPCDTSNSRSSSAYSKGRHSKPKRHESLNNDMPLNLSKKI